MVKSRLLIIDADVNHAIAKHAAIVPSCIEVIKRPLVGVRSAVVRAYAAWAERLFTGADPSVAYAPTLPAQHHSTLFTPLLWLVYSSIACCASDLR